MIDWRCSRAEDFAAAISTSEKAPCVSDAVGGDANGWGLWKTVGADKPAKGGCMKQVKAKRLQKVSCELMVLMKNT